jgi:hypothetical protein
MQKIHLIEQNDLSIDEYYSAFDRLMGPLVSMVPQCIANDCPSYKFIEKFFTYKFVKGLKVDFEAIHTRLLHGSATLIMSPALSDLLVEETHLQSITDSHDLVPHSVMAASQRYNGSRGSSSESLVSTTRRPVIGQKIVLKDSQQSWVIFVLVVLLMVMALDLHLEA